MDGYRYSSAILGSTSQDLDAVKAVLTGVLAGTHHSWVPPLDRISPPLDVSGHVGGQRCRGTDDDGAPLQVEKISVREDQRKIKVNFEINATDFRRSVEAQASRLSSSSAPEIYIVINSTHKQGFLLEGKSRKREYNDCNQVIHRLRSFLGDFEARLAFD